MKNTKKKGFTLIELLVVIAIIGVLSAIGLVALTGARGKARDAKRISDLRQYALSYQSFIDSNGNSDTSCALNTAVSACSDIANFFAGGTANAPTDPSGVATGCADAAPADDCCDDTANYTILYENSASDSFAVGTRLESGSGGFSAGAINASQRGLEQTCPYVP